MIHEGVAQRVGDGTGQLSRRVAVAAGCHQRELVAAQTGDLAAIADRLAKALGLLIHNI